jgi:IclR family acetate operon transcriptional repressor
MIIDMLTAIDRFGRTTPSDLALILDIPTATTHRVLKTLETLEFVSFDKET